MYAVYHGPDGIKKIAQRIHLMTVAVAHALKKLGYRLDDGFFNTLYVDLTGVSAIEIHKIAESKRLNLRKIDSNFVGITIDESATLSDLEDLVQVFAQAKKTTLNLKDILPNVKPEIPSALKRESLYLTHPVFNSHHSETKMLRYITMLQGRDLSLAQSMIALGSCTMKLNATSEMIPVTWPEVSKLHPFIPESQREGYTAMINGLEKMLAEITGFAGISLQPNAGSQGEYAGLLVIRKYQEEKGESHRDICLIPQSAHGTNPASAAMAGMKIIVVQCDSSGNVDVADLKNKAELHAKNLSALMITYPSTHGVFEESILEICEIIHANGGQVYMDGANMNAQVGLCRPGDFGPDVCHLNLHKTFCIPHGGGGPGMGPIGVAAHLTPHLPGHPIVQCGGEKPIGAISAAPWGSASILPISYLYIQMMGEEGLKRATEVAILNANYVAKKLEPHYPVLYKGKKGFVAHECIIDLRPIKDETGIEVEDVAKRLMDYGFHAPTISFPVPGTMMIEPTESESLDELDRFCEAMAMIREEMREVAMGSSDRKNNLLKNAPHTSEMVTRTEWPYSYSRERAAFPVAWVRRAKFWPSVARVDNVYGERNLVCACPPVEAYQ